MFYGFEKLHFLKNLAKFVLPNGQLKKNLTVSRFNNSSNKEWEIQDMGDEDIMYKPLLDNIDVETLTNESDFEIDTASPDRLQVIKQENPIVKDEGSWQPREDRDLRGRAGR